MSSWTPLSGSHTQISTQGMNSSALAADGNPLGHLNHLSLSFCALLSCV